MHVLPPYRRILLLTEGYLGVFTAKTAATLLRYRPADVVGIVDGVAAGADVRSIIPWAPAVPIVADVEATLPHQPEALFVGVAPPGGALPPAMRRHVESAIEHGLDIVSGLHEFLADDPTLAAAANRHDVKLFDLRRPPTDRVLARGHARGTRCRRILTVGTDGNVGKMAAALELTAAARRRGLRAEFLATGQSGTMIVGRGIAVDAIAADFAPGAVEELVLEAADADVCIIEGQGSLAHPGFSTSTLALLHGACPDALILAHHVGRTHYSATPDIAIPPLRELRAVYEQVTSLLHPALVTGVALNPHGQDERTWRTEARHLEQELRLPVDNVFADGADRLLDAALA